MLIDNLQITEGSSIQNLTVPSGTSDPVSPSLGELFFRTDLGVLRTYNGTAWAEPSTGTLSVHTSDTSVHLSSEQNTFLDGLNLPSLTSAHVNFVQGLTSNAQIQFNTLTTNLGTHIADDDRHLTAAQNTLVDGITASAAELNSLVGISSPVQTQLNSVVSTNNAQNNRLSILENTTVPVVQVNLDTHIADGTVHLTAAQNTLLDGTITNGIVAADIAKLSGAAAISGTIAAGLSSLQSNKISADGTIGMQANLSLGMNRIVNLGTPIGPNDAATKDYVDSFVQGLHWVGSARVGTTGNISLSGIQTIDGVLLSISDRVLVKNQGAAAQNGIYLVASGAWSRATDYNTDLEVNNSAVFVLEGTTQSKSTWVQINTVTTLGTSAISFTAFSGPVVNTAGGGIVLAPNGTVSINEGAGITFDGAGAVVLDLHTSGGLMLTTNNSTAATLTTVAAQLALTNTGVAAGTVNNSASAVSPLTIDAKGRITTVGTAVTITPSWASITSKPTTLSGFGITDAVLKTGDTMSGDLIFTSGAGTQIRSTNPPVNSAWFSTTPYGVSQGDNRTHFGYNNSGTFENYIRGVLTTISGSLTVVGASSFSGTVTAGGIFVGGFGNITTNGTINTGDANVSNHLIVTGLHTSQRAPGVNLNIANSGGTGIGGITNNGTNVSFNTASDERLKENISPASSSGDDIDAIQVRSFDWKSNGKHQKYGFIAQELYEVHPDAVTPGETWSVDYSKLVPVLMKEVQDLRTRTKNTEDVLSSMMKELADIKAELKTLKG